MSEEKISLKSILSKNVRVDNSNDAERAYDISAEVEIVGGRIQRVRNGVVRPIDEGIFTVAWTYIVGGIRTVSYSDATTDEELSVLAAIHEFCSNLIASGVSTMEVAPVRAIKEYPTDDKA